MNILITGASGFIGQHVIAQFEQTHHQLYLLSRDTLGSITFEENNHWFIGDLNQPESYVLPQIDIIIDLAWSQLDDFNSRLHRQEYEQHEKFLYFMIKRGVKSIFVAGTCLEYGVLEGQLDESTACIPTTEYGKAKYQLYQRLNGLQQSYEFNLVWGRIFYIYGNQLKRKSLFDYVSEAINSNATEFNMSHGQQERDFISVELVAEYIAILACLNENVGIVNLCSGRPKTVEEQVLAWFGKKEITLNLGAVSTPKHEAQNFWGCPNKLMGFIS